MLQDQVAAILRRQGSEVGRPHQQVGLRAIDIIRQLPKGSCKGKTEVNGVLYRSGLFEMVEAVDGAKSGGAPWWQLRPNYKQSPPSGASGSNCGLPPPSDTSNPQSTTRSPPMELRPYQTRMVNKALEGNTIIVLPTGSGKTLIAAECARRHGPGSTMLFLVPMCILVGQQARAIREWSSLRVAELSGEKKAMSPFDVLVATPKAFQNAQERGEISLAWHSFKHVVLDEVHHVLKEHPYRVLAAGLTNSGARPLVLGLSASLTYAIGEEEVNVAVQRLCDELRITQMETASCEELQMGGYHASNIMTEVRTVDVPAAVIPGLLPVEERQAHLMAPIFWERVERNQATGFAATLAACVRALEAEATRADPSFASPLALSLKEWGAYAHGRSGLGRELEPWYEALRLLVISWEEAQDAAVVFLRMCGVDKKEHVWSAAVQPYLQAVWASAPQVCWRFENLKEVLLGKLDGPNEFRGIVFVEQRVMTHILSHVISSDIKLSQRLRPHCIYARSAPATASLKVTQSQVNERMKDFSTGCCNLLISTATAEEGLDIASANCVIRFDPVIHAVSLVQGRGRARQAESSHVVLAQRDDRTVSVLQQTEQDQLARVRFFVPEQEGQGHRDRRLREAQVEREQTARGFLEVKVEPGKEMEVLCLFVTKTKALLTTSDGTVSSPSCEIVGLEYKSVLRTLKGSGSASSQKEARQLAAQDLLQQLWRVVCV